MIMIMIMIIIIVIVMIPPDEELAEPVLALSKEDADEVADDTWGSESWGSSRSWWGRRRRQPSRWKRWKNAAYPGRGPNARGPKPSVGPKSVETVVAAAVPAEGQSSVQRVDRGSWGRHLPRLLSHLGYYVIRSHLVYFLFLILKKLPCRAWLTPRRWMTQGPQYWPHHIPGKRAFYSKRTPLFADSDRTKKERKGTRTVVCVKKVYRSIGWVGGLLSGYQLISISGGAQYKNYSWWQVAGDLPWRLTEAKITLER